MSETKDPAFLAPLPMAELQAEIERLRKAMQDFLTGDYPNPRQHRPGKCQHGTNYWDECSACDTAHFEAALAYPSPTPRRG